LRNVNFSYQGKRRTDYSLSSKRTKIHVFWKILVKSFKKSLIILRCVEFLSSKKLCLFIFPCSFKEVDFEARFELGWNILKKGEDSAKRMLISEDIENEALFSNKSVTIGWNPVFRNRLTHLDKTGH
jgi:hypothetical protein